MVTAPMRGSNAFMPNPPFRSEGALTRLRHSITRKPLNGRGVVAGKLGLEREILGGGLMQDGGIRQVTVWVNRRAAESHFVVEMRGGGAARAAHGSHDLAAMHFLARPNPDAGKVRIPGLG